MFKVHQPHRKSGYLSSVSYEATQDPQGRPDWIMRYVPGPKAVNEYQYFTGRTGVLERKLETKHTLSASLQNEPNIDLQLMTELPGRGHCNQHAMKLVQNSRPGQHESGPLEDSE